MLTAKYILWTLYSPKKTICTCSHLLYLFKGEGLHGEEYVLVHHGEIKNYH